MLLIAVLPVQIGSSFAPLFFLGEFLKQFT